MVIKVVGVMSNFVYTVWGSFEKSVFLFPPIDLNGTALCAFCLNSSTFAQV